MLTFRQYFLLLFFYNDPFVFERLSGQFLGHKPDKSTCIFAEVMSEHTYDEFIEAHEAQLRASGVGEQFWPALHRKLAAEVSCFVRGGLSCSLGPSALLTI